MMRILRRSILPPMRQIASLFVDTSGWATPVVHDAAHSAEMEAFSRQIVTGGRALLTTKYVITELIALLTIPTPLSPPQFFPFVGQVKQVAQVLTIPPDLYPAA